MSARKNFLSEIWQRYPSSLGLTPRGRVSALGLNACEIDFKHWTVAPVKSEVVFFAKDVLSDGDWIELDVKNQIVRLLSPNMDQAFQAADREHIDIEKKQMRLQQWNEFLKCVREFFTKENFIEVATPTLVACPGTEPNLDVFSTVLMQGSEKKKLYLPTSPELHLKKALSLGMEKIFEIKPCFRNNEKSETHQPEFYMLEWYRSFEDLNSIQKDVCNLIRYLKKNLDFTRTDFLEAQSLSMAQMWKEYLNFNLTPQTTLAELQKLAQANDISLEDNWDDQFFRIFVEKIENNLPEKPFFLNNYPPSQAALARLTIEGWGDRFEFYWKGIELANAFNELNDPEVQADRFQKDLAEKTRLGKESISLDKDFELALNRGLPPSAGIALGLERLFMVLAGLKKIEDVKLFPY